MNSKELNAALVKTLVKCSPLDSALKVLVAGFKHYEQSKHGYSGHLQYMGCITSFIPHHCT